MKGILFKPEMTQAIREGRKTVTRRIMNPQPSEFTTKITVIDNNFYYQDTPSGRSRILERRRYRVGEVVYIKEAWHYLNIEENKATPYDFGIEFADGEILWWTDNGNEMNYPLDEKMRSPIFLKAKFARYFIRITDVRPERLQEITEADCRLEGSYMATDTDDEGGYVNLWDSINGDGDFALNKWVWRYAFKLVSRPEEK